MTAVVGNLIGTDATGLKRLANAAGVAIETGATRNSIGGSAVGSRNVISGNVGAGIALNPLSSRTFVAGNYVGTDGTGVTPLANGGAGISGNQPANDTIGGTDWVRGT